MWPEVLRSTRKTSQRISRAVASRELRPLGLSLYTSNFDDPIERIIRRNLWPIVGMLAPGAVVSFRTALEGKPSQDGTVFLVGRSRYERDLPGLQLRVVKGPGPQEDDQPFIQGLYMASRARTLLESLKPSRQRSTAARGLPVREIEATLEREFRNGGEKRLNAIRDQAARIADALGAEAEFRRLTSLISILLGSLPGEPTQPTAAARLAGDEYDSARLELFEQLFAHLQQRGAASRPVAAQTPEWFATISFFDAYFSNFIEGTEFEVDEARAIIFDGVVPEARPEDAHDILGTYRIVGNRNMMLRSIISDASIDTTLERLQDVHARIMEGRPSMRPGLWKEKPNRAGDSRFVEPLAVRGTLRRGLEMMRALEHPFQRAAGLMFVVAEVHPFDDGNGRVARVFMNMELAASNEARIIIPSVYREEYLSGLRQLTRNYAPRVFVEVLDFAQRWVSAIDWSSYATAERQLRAVNAFDQPGPDVRLLMPR